MRTDAVTAFIRARVADDRAGPGSAREWITPEGKPCPAEDCDKIITLYRVDDHIDQALYYVSHDHLVPRSHDWDGSYAVYLDWHRITLTAWDDITTGEHTEAARAVQDRCRAILAVVDALDDVTANNLPGRDGLQIAVELLAATWRRHPAYSTALRREASAGDDSTYVDTRDTSHQQDQRPTGRQSTP